MDIASLGLKVDSTQAAKAADDLDKLAAAGKTAEGSAKGVGKAWQDASKQQAAVARAAASTVKPMDQLGMSAKQTSMALRQVPMQVTDIVTGLASGQAPMQVLLQQGGQLKDMFGGIAPAAKALGGYVAGLINPFTVAAAAAGALAYAYSRGSKEADAYNSAIILTGNAAGTTAGALQAMASRVSDVVGTQHKAAEVVAAFAANGNIAGNSIERFAQLAVRLERDAGQSVSKTVEIFASLGKDPVAASVKLNEATRHLTSEVYLQIKALEDMGRASEAAALAQDAYFNTMSQRTSNLEGNLGLIEGAWRAVAEAASWAWDKMLGIGRTKTLQDQMQEMQAQLKLRLEQGPLNPLTASSHEKGNENLRQRIAALANVIDLQSVSAQQEKEANDRAAARVKWESEGDKYLGKRAQMEREIAQARALGASAGLKEAEVEKRVAAIREKYRDKGAESRAKTAAEQMARARLRSDLDTIRASQAELVSAYDDAEKILEAKRAANLVAESDYYQARHALIELDAKARDEEYRKEIDRRSQEKLTGDKQIENEREIAELTAKRARLQEQTTVKHEVLAIQQAAANDKVAKSFKEAEAAAQAYLDTLNQQQQRELDSMGRGTQNRDYLRGRNQIEDRYASQRLQLESERRRGSFDNRPDDYQKELDLINRFQAEALRSYDGYYSQQIQKQGDWALGMSEALNNYFDEASNVYKQTSDFFGNTMRGMEDAITSFVTTGKASFADFAQSVITEIVRIQVRAAAVNFLGMLGMSSGASAPVALAGVVSGGSGIKFKAAGGPVDAGGTYIVGEKGPELLRMGARGGHITPNHELRGGPSISVTNNVSPGITRGELLQALQMSEERTKASILESMRRAGAFA